MLEIIIVKNIVIPLWYMKDSKNCKPKDKSLKAISCDMQGKIEAIQAFMLAENPHREKISETEAIFKAIHEYHKSISKPV